MNSAFELECMTSEGVHNNLHNGYIEAVLTQEARDHVDTQESEEMATLSRALNRKVAHRYLADKSVWIYGAYHNFNKALGVLITNLESVLNNNLSTQMNVRIQPISSKLASVRHSFKRVQEATQILQGSLGEGAHAPKSPESRITEFCSRMEECHLLLGLHTLHDYVEMPTPYSCEEEKSSRFAVATIPEYKKLKDDAKLLIAELFHNNDVIAKLFRNNDIEAVSTQEDRAPVDTQESENMVTQSQTLKRKAEDQSLEDEPASSKFKSDAQPAVAESAYEPDTMLSSATVSSACEQSRNVTQVVQYTLI